MGHRTCFLPLLWLPLTLLLLQPWPCAPPLPFSAPPALALRANSSSRCFPGPLGGRRSRNAAASDTTSKRRESLGDNKTFEDLPEVLPPLSFAQGSSPCQLLPTVRARCSSRSSVTCGRWRCQGHHDFWERLALTPATPSNCSSLATRLCGWPRWHGGHHVRQGAGG